MVNRMMLPLAFEGLIAAKGIGVVDRALAGLGPDMAHQFLGTHRFDDLGIAPPIPLQQAEYDAFARRPPASLTLTPAAEVGLVQLDLALELAALQLGDVVQHLAQALVDTGDHLDVQPHVLGQPIGRLKLEEAPQNSDFTAQASETFNLAAMSAFNVAAAGLADLERTAKHTLPAPQKVGRTTEMACFPSNHAYLPVYDGYETP